MSKIKPEPRFYHFRTPDDGEVLLDLDMATQVWEGKAPGTIAFVFGDDEPVVVLGDFNLFTDGWVEHFDCRDEIEKGPRERSPLHIVG